MARAGGGRSGGGSFGGGGRSSFGGGSRSGGGRSSFSGGSRSGGGSFFGGSSNSRSAGGAFGGSSGSGGFFSGPSRNNYGGGGLFGGGFGRNSRPNRTVIVNNMNNNRFGGSHSTYGGPAGNGGNPNLGGGTHPGGCSKGCLIAVIVVLAFVIITALVVASMGGVGDSDITASTIQREPLPAGSVTETDYYRDELGWIGNETELLKGLKNFYRATGVQPYLYITDHVGGAAISDVSELEAYAQELYPQLFSDEAHLLFIFYERNEEYADYYLCGAQAKTVIDREAGDILLDYIDRYYYSSGMSDEEFFSRAFDDAAARIMTVEKSPWPMVWIAFGIAVIILILFLFWRERVKQKNRKAEQDAKILETPLEQFGDVEVDELEKKYKDKDKGDKDEF